MWTGKKNNCDENLTQDLFLFFFFKAREQLVKKGTRERERERERKWLERKKLSAKLLKAQKMKREYEKTVSIDHYLALN